MTGSGAERGGFVYKVMGSWSGIQASQMATLQLGRREENKISSV